MASGKGRKPVVAKRAKNQAMNARLAGEGETRLVITSEIKRQLVEDVAYFRAARYRDARPGECREADRSAARQELHAVLKRPKAKLK